LLEYRNIEIWLFEMLSFSLMRILDVEKTGKPPSEIWRDLSEKFHKNKNGIYIKNEIYEKKFLANDIVKPRKCEPI